MHGRRRTLTSWPRTPGQLAITDSCRASLEQAQPAHPHFSVAPSNDPTLGRILLAETHSAILIAPYMLLQTATPCSFREPSLFVGGCDVFTSEGATYSQSAATFYFLYPVMCFVVSPAAAPAFDHGHCEGAGLGGLRRAAPVGGVVLKNAPGRRPERAYVGNCPLAGAASRHVVFHTRACRVCRAVRTSYQYSSLRPRDLLRVAKSQIAQQCCRRWSRQYASSLN